MVFDSGFSNTQFSFNAKKIQFLPAFLRFGLYISATHVRWHSYIRLDFRVQILSMAPSYKTAIQRKHFFRSSSHARTVLIFLSCPIDDDCLWCARVAAISS